MRFEVLKRSNLKRNIIIGVVVVAIIAACIITMTRAKYRTVASTTLIKGEVNYTLADLNIVAITLDGSDVTSLSIDSNYTLLETSYCEVDGKTINVTLTWSNITRALTIEPFTTRGTKCYLDFATANTKIVDTVLGKIEVNLDEPDFSKTSCSSGCGEATVGIYEETIGNETVYYYRGDVDNNYVKFANFWWRIIRINEDGSIRLIYQGKTATDTGLLDEPSAFNSYNVGYTYTEVQQRPTTSTSGDDSTIKIALETWYEDYISDYDSYVTNEAGFCNDRVSYSNSSGSDEPSWEYADQNYYGAYVRLVSTKEPTLECSNSLDLYTTKVGLITADEVVYAGGQAGIMGPSNRSYYLYTGSIYWTISPAYDLTTEGYVFLVNDSGYLRYDTVDHSYGVRPVINIKSNVTVSGSGTETNPYTLSGL